MIKIKKITIHEFRGIRDITLEPNEGNFAACGRNGTGKSGIVDAIEFGLTGNVSRLSGRGTGGLSVKQHGPHVDSRNKPDESWVLIEVSIPSLKIEASIKRSVKDAASPTITPDTQEVKEVFAHIAQHPEFVLSRRELIRYILSEPGQRSKEVQALLRLEELEKVRKALQKVANESKKELPSLEQARTDSGERLRSALNISRLNEKDLLKSVNDQRAVLGLNPITTLEANTSIKDGMASGTSSQHKPIPIAIPKEQAALDMKTLRKSITSFVDQIESGLADDPASKIDELKKDKQLLENLSRESLLQQALDSFNGENCPVCDKEWDDHDFREHLAGKLAKLEEVKEKRAQLEVALKPIIQSLETMRTAIQNAKVYGPRFKNPVDVSSLEQKGDELKSAIKNLQDITPLDEAESALLIVKSNFSAAEKTIAVLEAEIKSLPEPSKQDSAKEYLTVGQERLDTYRNDSLKLKTAKERAKIAEAVSIKYNEVVTRELDEIYKQVEEKFVEYYRKINSDDESDFTAKLKPSMGKLGFDVDFYGRGKFPPGAYHSEGHQDSMGVALYLALMQHLLGDAFTLSVLDDVLMSVDAGHRREVCKLLQTAFPNTQFIFTTHDDTWLRHMKAIGMVKSKGLVHFRTWTVETGPSEWDSKDVWTDIDEALVKNEVKKASAYLREYLEHFATEACDQLRARVEFHGDAQLTLGELLPNAIEALSELYTKGKEAENSWGNKDNVKDIAAKDKLFKAAVVASQADQWQINAAVHYNSWANLDKKDFEPVVEAFKELLEVFACKKCESLLYVSPGKGPVKESLRCQCGEVNINLIKKDEKGSST
ncbi:MAG: chromosome segregation protein SMC [Parcubacteria group bacterium]|nr:chromosome segregation protein SMC [Parcubacteria group bacterium]